MTFEQITNPKKEVRVLRNTRGITTKEANDLIGKICEIRTEYHYKDTIEVWDEEKTWYWVFNRSDVQFLVPEVMYEGQRVGLGDIVTMEGSDSNLTVYGYHWVDGEWTLDVVLDNDFEKGCYERDITQITSHTPLYKETKTLTRQEIADKFGIALEDLKIEG